MEYLYLAIARAVGGLKAYAMKTAGRRAPGPRNALIINLFRSVICLAVSLAVWCFSGFGTTDAMGNLLVLISGIGNAVNLYFWIRSSGVVSLCLLEVFIMIGTVLVPIVISPALFPGESITTCQIIGCAALLVAVLIFASQEKVFEKGKFGKSIPVILLCTLGSAITVITQKAYNYYISAKDLGGIPYFNLGTFLVVFLAFALVIGVKRVVEVRGVKASDSNVDAAEEKTSLGKVWYLVAIAAVSLYIYQYFITLAATLDSAIYYPMSYILGMIATMVVDLFVFKEKMTVKKAIGFVFVFGALILINL